MPVSASAAYRAQMAANTFIDREKDAVAISYTPKGTSEGLARNGTVNYGDSTLEHGERMSSDQRKATLTISNDSITGVVGVVKGDLVKVVDSGLEYKVVSFVVPDTDGMQTVHLEENTPNTFGVHEME